jgi:hypothetical protein
MQRFSNYFNLGLTQASLDFVNIDVAEDSPVYIDPHAIRTQQGTWIEACQDSITSYFDSLLDAIRNDDAARLRDLIGPLTEPNETHLGESKGKSSGRSLGSEKRAQELISALRRSRAIQSGQLTDLEESILFVDGVGIDILSDITTCLIRSHLIEYTKNQCKFHGVTTEPQFAEQTWDAVARAWLPGIEHDLPRGPDGSLLLVPKSIVRVRPELDKDKFFKGYIRPFYEQAELSKGVASDFVRLIAAGTKRARMKVNLTDLGDHVGTTKAAIARHAEDFPEAIKNYRADKSTPTVPLDNAQLAERVNDVLPNFGELLDTVSAIAPGRAGATPYHRSVAAFLTAAFSASLGNERLESVQHGGLKRVDITYDNVAGDGFFRWLSLHYPSAIVVVECKNYENDPANPELDQIAMRFSPDRGRVGLLVTRRIVDKPRMEARCRSAAVDGHGYVIALDDADLRRIAEGIQEALANDTNPREFPLLRERFGKLIGQG